MDTIKKALPILTLAILLFGCNMNPSKGARIEKLEAQIEESLERLNQLEKKVEELEKTNSALKSKIEEIENQ